MTRYFATLCLASVFLASTAFADVIPPRLPDQRPTRIDQRSIDGRPTPPIHSKMPPRILRLNAAELTQEGAYIYFRPNRQIRRATYFTYRIPQRAFFRTFPSMAVANGQRVRCRVWRRSSKQHNVPAGTITTLTYDCASIQRISPTVRANSQTIQSPSANRDGRTVPFQLPIDQFRITRRTPHGTLASFTTFKRGKIIPRKAAIYERFEITPSNRQSAIYVRLWLPKAQLDRVLKGRTFSKLTLLLQIEKVRSSRYTPPPNMPSPVGGFIHREIYANLQGVGVVP